MRMKKKHLLSLAMFLTGAMAMTSCSDNGNDGPLTYQQAYSKGAYVLNYDYDADNSWLTAIDYDKGTATNYFDKKTGGSSIGETAYDGVLYGSKIYVTLSNEENIAVIDKATMKIVKKISTAQMLGNGVVAKPMCIVADAGNLYFTLEAYDSQEAAKEGYVAAVDTINYALQNKWKVDYHPEHLVKMGDLVYVSNLGKDMSSLSCVNLSSDQVETKSFEGLDWPEKVYVAYNQLCAVNQHVVSSADGSYYTKHTLKSIDFASGKSTTICDDFSDATLVYQTAWGTRMEFTPADAVFYVLNRLPSSSAKNLVVKRFALVGENEFKEAESIHVDLPADFESPYKIAVDPLNYHIFLFGETSEGNGCVVECDMNGKVLHEYQVGADVSAILFDSAIRTAYEN